MRTVTLFLLTMLTLGASAEVVDNSKSSELSKKAVAVKQSVLELNRELYQLEEDLLSPATTRAAIYFSLSNGEFFDPYSIDITFDGKVSSCNVSDSELNDKGLERRLASRCRLIAFKQRSGVDVTTVEFPIRFIP